MCWAEAISAQLAPRAFGNFDIPKFSLLSIAWVAQFVHAGNKCGRG
jgi:hypothetical protein